MNEINRKKKRENEKKKNNNENKKTKLKTDQKSKNAFNETSGQLSVFFFLLDKVTVLNI